MWSCMVRTLFMSFYVRRYVERACAAWDIDVPGFSKNSRAAGVCIGIREQASDSSVTWAEIGEPEVFLGYFVTWECPRGVLPGHSPLAEPPGGPHPFDSGKWTEGRCGLLPLSAVLADLIFDRCRTSLAAPGCYNTRISDQSWTRSSSLGRQ